MKNAEVKQEDMSDKIELLKKVEITFHELYERRHVYAHADAGSLKNKETALHIKRRGDRTKHKIDQQAKFAEEKRKQMQEKQMKRDQLITFATKKQSHRSTKPALNMKKKEHVKVNAEEQDIINYIGGEILQFMKEGQ